MTNGLNVIGLLALLHRYNAATMRCISAPLFAAVGYSNSGQCVLEDSEDITKLTLIQDSVTDSSSRDILPYTHYTLPYPNTTATQDFIQFEDDLHPLQAYTHYITPKRDAVTMCSPYECIQIPGVTTHFYITPSDGIPKEKCPENQFIFTLESSLVEAIMGACITLNNPELKYTVSIHSSPSSFFYISREDADKYHTIDHRFSPPKEDFSRVTTLYAIGFLPIARLVHLKEFNSEYLFAKESSHSPPLLGVTGSYYFLKQKVNRRYIVQTHAALYSLLDNGKGSLTLEREDEEYHRLEKSHFAHRRVVLQIFPDGFKLPSEGLPEAMRYSALYKEAYGYESIKVERTLTGAYALMRAVDYVNAMGGKLEGRMRKHYARFGASYVFSMTTYLRNMKRGQQREALKTLLEGYGKKDWDQVGQEASLNDEPRRNKIMDAEGGAVWLSKSKNSWKEEEEDSESENKEGSTGGRRKLSRVGRVVLVFIVALVLIGFLAWRIRKKPSVEEIPPTSSFLTNQRSDFI